MSAYLQGIGSATAGQQVTTRMTITIPSSTDLSGSRAIWEVLDMDGFVWANGDCSSVASEISAVNPNAMQVAADATIILPGDMECNGNGTRYQVRYTLITKSTQIASFEQFIVVPPVASVVGALDVVEIAAQCITARMVLPHRASNVTCAIWSANSQMTPDKSGGEDPERVQGGWLYKVLFETKQHASRMWSVEPYSLIWTYEDDSGRNQDRADMFMVNPGMLDAVREIQSYINRAYTDTGIAPGTTFKTGDCMRALRWGKDQFNAVVKPTNFTMTNAVGQFRYFWIGYACVFAARAQALAEGMKAFDYGGQTITLNVDRSQYWDTMATNLESQLNEQIKNFKDNLCRRGNVQGDGSFMGLAHNGVGTVGVTLHAASPFRVLWGQNGSLNVPNLWT
jgi:hypothetical protein